MLLSQEGHKAFRNYEKCQQCRHDHKQCIRQPQSLSEKCERCTRLGHECGPPVKAKTRGRPRTNLGTDRERKKTCQSSATCACPFQKSLSTSWLLSRVPYLGRASYGLVINATAQKMFYRYCSDLQFCLKSRLSSLRTFVDDSINRCEWFKGTLGWYLSQLHRHQLFGHQELWSRNADIHTSSGDDISSSLDHGSDGFKVLLCSANILTLPIHKYSQRKDIRDCFDRLPAEYYKSTESALENLIESIFGNIAGEEDQSNCAGSTPFVSRCKTFPASHIAYLNLDRDAALELWTTSSSVPDPHTDILGRTLLHMAAEAGDTKFLESIDVQLLRKVKSDRRGFTLLDLAKISRSTPTIKFIIENDIVPHFEESISTDVYMCNYEQTQEHYLSQLEVADQREACDMETDQEFDYLSDGYGYKSSPARLEPFAYWDPLPQSDNYERFTNGYQFTETWPSGFGDNTHYLCLQDATSQHSPPMSFESVTHSSWDSPVPGYEMRLPHQDDSDTDKSAFIDLTQSC